MAEQVWQQPFFEMALPIMATIVLATWCQNNQFTNIGKRIDDLRTDMNARFGGIEKRLDKLESKVETLQERSWR